MKKPNNKIAYVPLADVVRDATADMKDGRTRYRYVYRCLIGTLAPFVAHTDEGAAVPKELANLCIERYKLNLRIKKALIAFKKILDAEKRKTPRKTKTRAKIKTTREKAKSKPKKVTKQTYDYYELGE